MAEKGNGQTTIPPADEEDSAFDDVEAALTGINMLLNNGFEDALLLFEKYKEESALMHAGYSFVYFMQALMSLEDDKVTMALKALQETEKRCELSAGFVRSVRRKFSKRKKSVEVIKTEDRIQRQVIVADSVLYQAILIFTNQDVRSYIKGGWHLRKAWKIYNKLHVQITRLKEKFSQQKIDTMLHAASSKTESGRNCSNSLTPNPQGGGGSATTTTATTAAAVAAAAASASSSSSTSENAVALESMCQAGSADNSEPAELNVKLSAIMDMSEETLARLLGAVNFGYGAFQLCMSMVPPKILKLIEFFGFEGDLEEGLACLEDTSHSRDMKAPLATLALLWYHTVLRPFFALDGLDRNAIAVSEGGPARKPAGTQEAEVIIREKEAIFPNSSLFLFFRGRIHKLRREAEQSYAMYLKAYYEAKGQREIELMCLYEISWFNLMSLNWELGEEGFKRLRKDSKGSRGYYTYLIGVCLGSQGNLAEASAKFQQISSSAAKKKNNQIEMFVLHRADKVGRGGMKGAAELYKLLALELIFLWHSLSACQHEYLQRFLKVCESQKEPGLFHLKCLLEGAIYNELGEEDKAVQCLKQCVSHQQAVEDKDDTHVGAFALFELAIIYMRSPLDKVLAKDYLQQIKDNYKDYDFENRLSVRVNNALEQLKREGTTASS
ncbi:hypothetical protein ACOMHN_056438 [Nucella lapillus]